MAKTIVQKVTFKNASPKDLFDLYMNAKKHTKATGAPAEITNKEGVGFTAHGSHITGQNLKLVKDNLIVQSWRGSNWEANDADSTFMLHFQPRGNSTTVHMVHSNIPDQHADGIETGWHKFYWEPWKAYLAGKPIEKYLEI